MSKVVGELPAFLGGRLCLDFVNTVDPREPAGHDFLPRYASLLTWATAARVLDEQRMRRAMAARRATPDEAVKAHTEAIALRETLYRVLRAAIARRPPSRHDSEILMAGAAHLQTRRRLRSVRGNWRWDWAEDDPLRLPHLIVLADALDLLTGEEVNRLGFCAGQPCGWLFVDATKNHSRRWCSMAGCGNRAKTRRHYQRLRHAR